MTSILFLMEAIYSYILRYKYLSKLKHFPDFYLPFLNLDSILNIFKKKMTLIADTFLNLGTPKYVVRYVSKNFGFRGPFDK